MIRAFDIYGFLDRNGFVSRALLHQLYAYPVMTIWRKVADYVQAERVRRSQPGHLWELEQLARRASQGPRHPVEVGTRDWPASDAE